MGDIAPSVKFLLIIQLENTLFYLIDGSLASINFNNKNIDCLDTYLCTVHYSIAFYIDITSIDFYIENVFAQNFIRYYSMSTDKARRPLYAVWT